VLRRRRWLEEQVPFLHFLTYSVFTPYKSPLASTHSQLLVREPFLQVQWASLAQAAVHVSMQLPSTGQFSMSTDHAVEEQVLTKLKSQRTFGSFERSRQGRILTVKMAIQVTTMIKGDAER
jgi:hypothetical protein